MKQTVGITLALLLSCLCASSCGEAVDQYEGPIVCSAIGSGFNVYVRQASDNNLVCDAKVTVKNRSNQETVLPLETIGGVCRYFHVHTGDTGEITVSVEKTGFATKIVTTAIPSSTCNTDPFDLNISI